MRRRAMAVSPRHWEESFLGLTIRDADNPVQLGHIVRSHDACLVCTTNMIRTGQRATHLPF
jgi:uptake hydrogenase large subunit